MEDKEPQPQDNLNEPEPAEVEKPEPLVVVDPTKVVTKLPNGTVRTDML